MSGNDDRTVQSHELPLDAPSQLLSAIRLRTPARVLAGRAGSSYRTPTLLSLRRDHAAARDAVRAEVDLARDLGVDVVQQFGLFEVRSRANSKEQYLLRPDLGRRLSDAGRDAVAANCPTGAELQIVIGDGLSAAAIAAQVPGLLPALDEAARNGGWRIGQAFFVRYCRVGVLNDVGALLDPEVVVMLVGERPGLATAESLSAYMAFRPAPGHTDAQRNLISNIHNRGVRPVEAVARILALAARMRLLKTSGVALKEERPAIGASGLPSLPS
jgi:ethanolamine ammonia-lyase small subunit